MLVKAVLKVVLVDVNSAVVGAWRTAFADNPEVQIVRGSILEQRVDAWVTPTNARGSMDGGLDAVLKKHFGARIEKKVQQEIRRLYPDLLPVGCATCVPTGETSPRFLISTPTMVRSVEDVSETRNVALACAAAFQAIHLQNRAEPGSIASVALPGLGARTGGVPVRICTISCGRATICSTITSSATSTRCAAALDGQLGNLEAAPESTPLRIQLPPNNDWAQ